MLIGAVTERYTQGLFMAAQSAGAVDEVDNGLAQVAEALRAQPGFRQFIGHPVIAAGVKENVVKNVFGETLHALLQRFLRLLFERGRSDYIEAIQRSFHDRATAARGQVEVRLESAMAFEPAALSRIVGDLAGALGKQVEARVVIRPELIAGYRIQLGNRIVDATVQGALSQFGARLSANRVV